VKKMSMCGYDPISTFFVWIFIFFVSWLLWKHLIKITILRAKYIELYKFTKLETELKQRKLSLEYLDNVEERILGLTPTTLNEVDERYDKKDSLTKAK